MNGARLQFEGRSISIASFSFSLVMLLVIVRLGVSIFLPALPLMGRELGIADHVLTATLTVYFVVYTFGGLLAGPLSDTRGRRSILFGGTLVCLAGTILCIFAQGLNSLMVGRVLQALGGSAIPVVSRAMIRDACDDDQMLQVMGWMGVFNSMTPILAPVMGGLITQSLGWRANFSLTAAITLAILLMSWRTVPETLPEAQRIRLNAWSTLRLFLQMMRAPDFLLVTLPLILCFILQGAYLASAPFVFIRQLHLSPFQFGLTGFALVLGLVSGRYLCLGLLKCLSPAASYVAGGAVAFAGGLSFLLFLALDQVTVWGALIPSFLFCLGFGSLLPLGQKSVLTRYREQGGTASALQTSLMLGSTAVGSALTGAMMGAGLGAISTLAWITGGGGLLILLSCLLSSKYVT